MVEVVQGFLNNEIGVLELILDELQSHDTRKQSSISPDPMFMLG